MDSYETWACQPADLKREQRQAVHAIFCKSHESWAHYSYTQQELTHRKFIGKRSWRKLSYCMDVMKQHGWNPSVPHVLPSVPIELVNEFNNPRALQQKRQCRKRKLRAIRSVFSILKPEQYTPKAPRSGVIAEALRIQTRRYRARIKHYEEIMKQHGWDPTNPEVIPESLRSAYSQ